MEASVNIISIAQLQQFFGRVILLAAFAASGCATQGHHRTTEWTAQGWLTPGPSGEPEIIGVYASEAECRAAAQGWMSRQVVGNPVMADCLPVDHN